MNFYCLDDIPEDLKEFFEPAPQIGLEKTPDEFVAQMVAVFREVRRVLRDDGTLWLNLGDSYASGKGTCFNPGGGDSSMEGHADLKANGAYKLDRGNKSDLERQGLKPKDLIGIPWRVAFALQADGWYLRQDIIWHKPNPMPESVLDRCTKAHEYIFLLSKSERYHFDSSSMQEPAIYNDERRPYGSQGAWDMDGRQESMRHGGEKREAFKERGHSRAHDGFNGKWDGMTKAEQCSGTRNKRSVWTVATNPYPGAHFATFPPELIKPCILAGCPKGGTVLDPFGGSGTTAQVARDAGCDAILIELNPAYIELQKRRLEQNVLEFVEVA